MRQLLTVTVTALLAGCAAPVANIAYNSASAISVVTTNKSLAELGASAVTQSDCSMLNYVFKGKDYICEQRDISTTYNRSGL